MGPVMPAEMGFLAGKSAVLTRTAHDSIKGSMFNFGEHQLWINGDHLHHRTRTTRKYIGSYSIFVVNHLPSADNNWERFGCLGAWLFAMRISGQTRRAGA